MLYAINLLVIKCISPDKLSVYNKFVYDEIILLNDNRAVLEKIVSLNYNNVILGD